MVTFKEFLITEAEQDEGGPKLFNPEQFRNAVSKVLDQLVKASAGAGPMYDEIVMLEALSVAKEVMLQRLEPYAKNPKYREYRDAPKGKDKPKGDDSTQKLMDNIEEQVKETLHTNFPKYKPMMNQIVNLIIKPILGEVKRVGPERAVKAFDFTNFNEKAADAFGYMKRYAIQSKIVPNAEDATVAREILKKWSADVRNAHKAGKVLTHRQRMEIIARSVEKFQDRDEPGM